MNRFFSSNRIQLVIGLLIILGGLLPAVHYWYFIGRVPAVTPVEARALLVSSQAPALLVDVRSVGEFNESHLAGAVSWPQSEIEALDSNQAIPQEFNGARLLLYCNSGIDSAKATQKLRQDFGLDALNVSGGLEAWIASVEDPEAPVFVSGTGEFVPVPYKESPVSEQAALATAILIFKPIYMLLSAALILWLWRFRSPEIRAIRWGLIAFLAGETFCAISIVFFNHADYLLELLHSYGMVVGFAFFAFAAVEMVDRRVLKFSAIEPGCALSQNCNPCVKNGGYACKVRQLALILIVAALALAFMPLTAKPMSVSYNTSVFQSPFNFSHPVVYQIFETRYVPVYAAIMLVAAIGVWVAGRGGFGLIKILVAGGIGALGFSFLRLMVFHFYSDNLVWFEFWEEATELMFIGGLAIVLWMFRGRLEPSPDIAILNQPK